MISVCLASYNGAKYIKEQVDSILSQLSVDDELVVSDDGSKDSTIQILESYNDSRIKIFHNTTNHGLVGNFENAILHSTGDIIFLSDQDDKWRNDKLEKVLEYFPIFDFVAHNALMVNGEGNSLGVDFFSVRNTKYGFWNNLFKMSYLGCCMAFKRECLKWILPFPKKILWHDMWIALILHMHYRGSLINDCLLYYRRHGDNLSPSGEKSKFSLSYKIKYRLVMFFNSLTRLF